MTTDVETQGAAQCAQIRAAREGIVLALADVRRNARWLHISLADLVKIESAIHNASGELESLTDSERCYALDCLDDAGRILDAGRTALSGLLAAAEDGGAADAPSKGAQERAASLAHRQEAERLSLALCERVAAAITAALRPIAEDISCDARIRIDIRAAQIGIGLTVSNAGVEDGHGDDPF